MIHRAGLEANALVWASVNGQLFVPGAVVSAPDAKTLTVAAFDVQRPSNQRKYSRTRVIPAFDHELNMEILVRQPTRRKSGETVLSSLSLANSGVLPEQKQGRGQCQAESELRSRARV